MVLGKRINRRIFQIPLFVFFTSVYLSISVAAGPNLPQNPANPASPAMAEKKKPKPADDEILIQLETIVYLGSGDDLEGTILFPEKISFKHYKNGLVFDKTVSPLDIREIKVLEYSGSSDDPENSDKRFFEFEPSSVQLTLWSGQTFILDGIFPFLKNFEITTHDGKTKLYMIFANTFTKKDGWSEISSKDINYHNTLPHPQAAYRIRILREGNN